MDHNLVTSAYGHSQWAAGKLKDFGGMLIPSLFLDGKSYLLVSKTDFVMLTQGKHLCGTKARSTQLPEGMIGGTNL